jgi:hypothetical protein
MPFGAYDGDSAYIKGVTDDALIGNIGDYLKVQNASLFGLKATYSATAVFTAPASATDIFTITGSATKTIKLLSVHLHMTATTGNNATCQLIRRSTANSAGTSTTPTVVRFDTTDPVGTAVVRAYTANPTLGTTVGTIFTDELYISGGATIGSNPFEYEYISDVGKPMTLRGTSEVFAINLNGVTFASNVCRANFVWTEE